MSTVEERNKLRLDNFLKEDAAISASLERQFRGGKLSPRSVLRCLMHVAGPESGILCGAAVRPATATATATATTAAPTAHPTFRNLVPLPAAAIPVSRRAG
jgi:hypothetical protein